MLEVLPLTHIRGRSLHDAFVIVDEAQSLERNVLLTVLSRIGQDSRVVLTHDVAQRDNLRVGRHDGIAAVIEALKGHPLFAHVTLTRSERSPVAALVTDMLEGSRRDGEVVTPGTPATNVEAGPHAADRAARRQHDHARSRERVLRVRVAEPGCGRLRIRQLGAAGQRQPQEPARRRVPVLLPGLDRRHRYSLARSAPVC